MNLKKYIQGNRKGKEAHHIEQKALSDPFLQEALEGFDVVKGDHAKRIETLQRQIAVASRPKQHIFAKWSVAASILLLISVGGYLLFTDKGDDKMLTAQQIQDVNTSKQVLVQKETEETKLVDEEIVSRQSIAEVKEERMTKKAIQREIESETSLLADEETLIADALIQRDTIIFLPMNELNALALVAAKETTSEQDSALIRIEGTITDSYGEPLIGVLVGQKDTNQRTLSDVNGAFSLTIKEPKGLTVQYIGYETLEIPAMQISNSMNIALHESKSTLEEVVVTGAGKQKKQTLTGAVTTVDVSELKLSPSADVSNTLAGNVAKIKANKSEPTIGMEAYENYLKESQTLLVDESSKPIKGTVKLSFYINKQGRPENITIEKSLNESANQEAIRLVKEGSDWTWSEEKVDITVQF